LVELIDEASDMQVSAGIDRTIHDHYTFPQYTEFGDNVSGDVIIDFSHFSVVPSILDFSEKTGIPAVICTTGLTEDIINRINEVSKKTALFRSGNMSLGINLLIDLVKKAAEVLQDSFDMEIIEKHHNKKLDAPSGTAKYLVDSMNDSLSLSKNVVYGREGMQKREDNEIGVHAIRGGTIAGEHTVLFAGDDEIIEIKHTALSKNVFVNGALKAAVFMKNQHSGLYTMKDVLNLKGE
jgi:4-hydroxy-tetrahydrodipicolinate reductase